MKKINRFSFLFGLMILIIFNSCNNNNQRDIKRQEVKNHALQLNEVEQKNKLPTTQIKFNHQLIKIHPKNLNEKIIVEYPFINIGNNPLYIENCKGSMAFIPIYKKDTVPPNGIGKIIGEFLPSSDKRNMIRHLAVIANTEPKSTILKLEIEY